MTKKEACTTHSPIGVLGLTNNSGVAIHCLDFGIEDYVYASYTYGDCTTFHKCKVYYGNDACGDCTAYFKIGKLKLNMSDFMRV